MGRKLGDRWRPKRFRESWKRRFVARVRGWKGPLFNFDQTCWVCGRVGRNLAPPPVSFFGATPVLLHDMVRSSTLSLDMVKWSFRGGRNAFEWGKSEGGWECRVCRRGRGPGRVAKAEVARRDTTRQEAAILTPAIMAGEL